LFFTSKWRFDVMNIVKSVMMVMMTAYTGSGLSNGLLPSLPKDSGIPWQVLKQGRGGRSQAPNSGAFNRSGYRGR